MSAPRERPILFSGEMMRALLAGRKTQTRRIIKPQPVLAFASTTDREHWSWSKPPRGASGSSAWLREKLPQHCPYGRPGDRLWVREAWAPYDFIGRQLGDIQRICYRADMMSMGRAAELAGSWPKGRPMPINGAEVKRWRPSIHMPRQASRVDLDLAEVRVERLQEITEADAQAEGVELGRFATYVDAYADLFDRINGAGAWRSNPWLWVLVFPAWSAPWGDV